LCLMVVLQFSPDTLTFHLLAWGKLPSPTRHSQVPAGLHSGNTEYSGTVLPHHRQSHPSCYRGLIKHYQEKSGVVAFAVFQSKPVFLERLVPCIEMKELEFTSRRYAERRRITVTPKCERRGRHSGRQLRAGQARAAYLMQAHRQNCVVCQCYK
jgi:hypothetical protein